MIKIIWDSLSVKQQAEFVEGLLVCVITVFIMGGIVLIAIGKAVL